MLMIVAEPVVHDGLQSDAEVEPVDEVEPLLHVVHTVLPVLLLYVPIAHDVHTLEPELLL